MQITLNLPDSLSKTETFNQSEWLQEIAIALPYMVFLKI
jgi:predicted HTH domain antitoxin